MKRLITMLAMCFLIAAAQAQNITNAEYFFDSDPGIGNGTAIAVSTPATVVNINTNISTASLSGGFHFIGIRVKDATGVWSLFEKRGFYISNTTADAANISAAEYFFDADPGVGNGTALPVGAAGATVNFSATIPTSLSAGFHFLAIRTKGTDGQWGLFEKRGFYISSSTADAANITAAEYFFDADPGVGNGTALSIGASGAVVNFSANIPTSLAAGFHFLAIRVKGADGIWGLYDKRGFYISSSTADAANITAAEYFFDTDPGVGNGTATSVGASGAVVNFTANLPTSLSPGFHFLAIRTKGVDGIWGLFEKRGFYISTTTADMSIITAAEYFFDTDPGIGSGTALTITTPGAIVTQTFLIPEPSLSLGSHYLSIRVKDANGFWSLYEYDTLNIGNSTISCPGNASANTTAGECTAIVNNIDPVISPIQSFTYTLSGATTGSGSGTASGQNFNAGVTTVKYILTGSPTVNCSFTVTVTPIAPAISIQPASQSVCTGTNVTFSVTAAGTGLTYQWRKGGVNIGGANTASFTITSTVAGNAGNYDVVVTSPCSLSTTSSVAVLTVGATNITTQPVSQAVCPDANVTFSVIASGASLTYQWRKGGVNISGANAASFTINNVMAADAGNYDVVVNSSCGTATSNIATLTVNAVTVISTNPSSQSVCASGNATFTAAATGTGVITYQWRKNSVNISGANSSLYTINGATNADAANYDVIATGTCGSVTSSAATLTVNAATVINTQLSNQSSCLGGSVTFTVVAVGTNLSYQWKKGGIDIAGAISSNYSINSISASDAATYTVVITGSCGNVTSNNASLTITAGTTINTQPVNQTSCLGGSVTFNVSASGSGTVTYQWKKNGTNITGAISSGLTINPVSAGDAANYTVVVSSACGNTESNIATLSILPATAITIQPVNQTVCLGANATFSVNASGDNLTYQWRKGTVNISGANSSSYTITGVAAGDVASYNVVVTGTCGSVTSSSVSLATGNVVISNQPVSQTVCAGTNVTFSVTATGIGLAYQWRKAGVNITGAITSTLIINIINGVTAGDAGSYDVVVTGTCGAVTSNAATLTVNAATGISTQPVSQTTCAGSNITFTVTATGSAITYQWRKGGVNISGAASSSFSLSAVAAGDAANYDAVVTGTCGSVTSGAATLIVNTAGTWIGISSSDWNTASNWCGGIPTSATDIIIPSSAPNMPNLDAGSGTSKNITISNGGTLTIGGAAVLDLFGSVSNNGTFNAATGNINFKGSGSQSMPAFTVTNVTLSGTGGVVLGGNVSINGTLTLIDGNITLGANSLTLAASSTGSVSSHIITNGTGDVVVKALAAAATRTVPVAANATTYNPVIITANAGHVTDDIKVRVVQGVLTNGTAGALITDKVVDKTWLIDEAVAGGSNVNISLQWAAASELPDFDRSKCYVTQNIGGAWETNPAAVANGTDPYTQTKNNVTGFSAFSVQILPIPRPSHGIFPNPVSTDLNVVLDFQNASSADFSVYDAAGKLVIEKNAKLNTGLTLTKINVAHLSKGIYVLKISTFYNPSFLVTKFFKN